MGFDSDILTNQMQMQLSTVTVFPSLITYYSHLECLILHVNLGWEISRYLLIAVTIVGTGHGDACSLI